MARRSTEAAIVVLAGQHKVNGLLPRQRIGVAQEMQSRQAPVYAIESQVLCQPIFQFVLPLMVRRQSSFLDFIFLPSKEARTVSSFWM